MGWVRIDDQLPDHPKFAAMGALATSAGWLHVCGLCYCNRLLTDGFIPCAVVPRLTLGYSDALVDALVTSGLWERADGGFAIHDYLDYQPSRESLVANRGRLRELRSDAGKKGAASRWQNGNSHSGDMANAKQTDGPNPNPNKNKTLDGKEWGEFWDAYPKRVAKSAALKNWNTRIRAGVEASTLVAAARNYAKAVEGKDAQYIMHPATFLGPNLRYEDYLTAPKPTPDDDDWYAGDLAARS